VLRLHSRTHRRIHEAETADDHAGIAELYA
jgi:hypothetical protein